MTITVEAVVIFVVALLIAAGIFLYLRSAAAALLKSMEQRVKSQAAKQELALLQAKAQLEASRREALESAIRLEKVRLQSQVQVLDETFVHGYPRQVFDSLEHLLSESRRAFVNSYRELDRFQRNVGKNVASQRAGREFREPLSDTAATALTSVEIFVGLHCRLPKLMQMHPEPYRDNALLEPLERISLLRSLSRTDDVLITLYKIAKYLQSGTRLTNHMNPEQKLKFSDYCISIVLLAQDSLVYQLVHFGSQILLEHVKKDMEVFAADEGVRLIREQLHAYDRLLETETEGDSEPLQLLNQQRREMIENLKKSAEQSLAIIQDSGAQVKDLHGDVTKRLYQLLSMRQTVENTLLVSREPSSRFQRLMEIGRGIEEELLPTLAGAFGYELIGNEKSPPDTK